MPTEARIRKWCWCVIEVDLRDLAIAVMRRSRSPRSVSKGTYRLRSDESLTTTAGQGQNKVISCHQYDNSTGAHRLSFMQDFDVTEAGQLARCQNTVGFSLCHGRRVSNSGRFVRCKFGHVRASDEHALVAPSIGYWSTAVSAGKLLRW